MAYIVRNQFSKIFVDTKERAERIKNELSRVDIPAIVEKAIRFEAGGEEHDILYLLEKYEKSEITDRVNGTSAEELAMYGAIHLMMIDGVLLPGVQMKVLEAGKWEEFGFHLKVELQYGELSDTVELFVKDWLP